MNKKKGRIAIALVKSFQGKKVVYAYLLASNSNLHFFFLILSFFIFLLAHLSLPFQKVKKNLSLVECIQC